MSVGDAGYFGGIRNRWEQFRPPKDPVAKEQKRADRQVIKSQIEGLQSDLESMKTQVKVLRQVVHNKPVKSKKTSRVVHGSGASVRPIGDRMASFIQLQSLERDIRAKKNEIDTLHQQIAPGRVGRVTAKGKEIAGKSLEEFFKYGVEGRGASVQLGPYPNPLMFLQMGLDTGWMYFWSRDTSKHIGEEKQMKELVNLAENRLVEIDDILRSGAIRNPAERITLLVEHKTLNDGLTILKEELGRDPISIGIQQTLSNGLKCIYSYSRFIQALSTVIPLVLQGTSQVMGMVGLATSVVTIPIGLFLSARGLSSCYKNIRTCVQNLKISIGLRNKELVTLKKDTECFADVHNMRQLDAYPALRESIQHANEQIVAKRSAINVINRDLRNGIKDKSIVAQKKADRANLELEIKGHREAVIEAVSNQHFSLDLVRDRVVANDILFQNSQALDSTLLPYIQQKTVIKTTLESLRVGAEGLTIVSTILTTSGLITTAAGGSGIPLISAGAIVGLTSLAVQLPVSMATKLLIKTVQGKNRVSTKQFNEELKSRLEAEVNNWDAIEGSGMANSTTSAIMFKILKKHYKSMPPEWGPADWAAALVNDPPEGKQWRRYNFALMKMRRHDDSRYLGEGLMAAAVKKLRKVI
ncbi:MAG: hypothetical protein Q8K75_09385 [Chlamydiales bacterium]|nr:hypothetical protein [Chlamydiales bacterium]